MLPVVLCGCETWSLTFRGAHRLRVFENRVLRKMCGLKRKETAAKWRRLHNEEFLYSCTPHQIAYYPGDQIKKNELKWACSTYVHRRRHIGLCGEA
jgi:hypothetical protein